MTGIRLEEIRIEPRIGKACLTECYVRMWSDSLVLKRPIWKAKQYPASKPLHEIVKEMEEGTEDLRTWPLSCMRQRDHVAGKAKKGGLQL